MIIYVIGGLFLAWCVWGVWKRHRASSTHFAQEKEQYNRWDLE